MKPNTMIFVGVAVALLWLWNKKKADGGPDAENDPTRQRGLEDSMADMIGSGDSDQTMEVGANVCQ
jgi:hypothetical protein